MVSEALELRMQGGRVSECGCMCVVGHGNGGLGWCRDGGGGWLACRAKPGGLFACQEMSKHFPSARDTLMTPDHIAVKVRSYGLGRAGIGRSS